MNVLFISNDPTIFDENSATRARMRTYASAIGNLHIVSRAPHQPQINRETVPNGTLSLYAVTAPKLFAFKQLEKQAQGIIERERIEIVSAQDPFEYGMIAAHVTKDSRAKLHIQVHTDFLSPWFSQPRSMMGIKNIVPKINTIRMGLAEQVLPQADGIRVVSKRVKDSMMERYKDRIKEPIIIPLTVSSEVPAPVRLPAHTFKFVLIAASRLEPEKRIQDIITALASIKDRYPSLGLMIAGDGSQRKDLEKLTRLVGLEGRVMFLGERPDAWGLMRSANAFIQASEYEGYGRTLIEAALAGIPIITTDVGIVGEVFRGYEEVLASPIEDPNTLAIHMMGLLEDNFVRKQLAENAQKAAISHLASVHTGPDVIAADLASLVTSVANPIPQQATPATPFAPPTP